MNLTKRWTSLFLALAMIASLIVIPAQAEDAFTISAETTTAKAGEIVTVNINVSNNTGFTALNLNVYYKAADLTCTKAPAGSTWLAFATAQLAEGSTAFLTANPDNTKDCSAEKAAAGWKLASLGYATQNAFTENGAIAQLTFQVASDAESCDSAIELEVVSCTANNNTDITAAVATANAQITINGVLPTLSRVTVTDGENKIVLDSDNKQLSDYSVTVNGTKDTSDTTLHAHAYSAKGTEITSLVDWTVSGYKDYGGVSIAADGTIVISRNAKGGVALPVRAAPVSEKSSGSQVNAGSLVIQRADPSAQSITLTPAEATVTIPGKGEPAKTITFTAAAIDQFGEARTGLGAFSWDVAGIASYKVLSYEISKDITECTVTVTSEAAPTDTPFEITVTSGDASAKATLTISRAASAVSEISISADSDTVAVPVAGADSNSLSLSATVLDQYGTALTDKTVTWSIAGDTPDGVELTTDGTLTVKTKAAGNAFTNNTFTFKVVAKCDGKSAEKEITLTREDAQHKGFIVANPSPINVPASGSRTVPLTVNLRDQYEIEMPMNSSTKLDLTLTDGGYVTCEMDPAAPNQILITVKAGADIHRQYLLTVSANDVSVDIALTLQNLTEDTTSMKVTQDTFTYGETGKLAPTATLNGETVNARFTYTDSQNQPVSDPTNAGVYTVIATYETAATLYTATNTFTIEPKSIVGMTVTLSHAEGKYEDGEFRVPVTFDGAQGTVDVAIDGLAKDTDFQIVGSGNTFTSCGERTIRIEGQGNYTGTLWVTYRAVPRPLELKSITFQSRAYDPDNDSVTETSVLFVDTLTKEEKTLLSNQYYVERSKLEQNGAGTQRVSFTIVLSDAKFVWSGADSAKMKAFGFDAGYTVEITKATHSAAIKSAAARYGNTATLDLSDLPEGFTLSPPSISDSKSVLAADGVSLSGKTLTFRLSDTAPQGEETAVVTYTVSSTNYADFTLTVTVKKLDKTAQTVTASDLPLVYGGSGKLTANGIGQLTYTLVSGENVIALSADGSVSTLHAGTAQVRITAAGDADTAPAETTVSVTVAPRPLTVRIDGKKAYVNDTLPTLTYTVSGLVNGDKLTVEPVLALELAPDVDPMKQPGTYPILYQTLPQAASDYALTTETASLVVTTRPSAITPVGPAAGTIRIEEPVGGSVRVSPSGASAGDTVTITVTPDAGQSLRSLEVLDKNGTALELTELGNGRFSFEMPRGKVTVRAVFAKASVSYPDVTERDWFYSAVEYVTASGLMNGTGRGFEPNANTTRAMIWAILARLSGMDTTAASGEWYSVAQQWAVASGVSDGAAPNGAITREQLVTMLYRYAQSHGIDVTEGGMAIREFTDAESVSAFAADAMTWAVNTGLINGTDGRLNPQGPATRSQVAAILMRFAQLSK